MRQCPFDGCTKQIKPEHFGCPAHWFSLNNAERAEIRDAYAGWRRGDVDGDTLRARQAAVLATWRARQTGAPKRSPCRRCLAPVVWVKTAKGEIMPLDAEPNEAGNIILDAEGVAHYLTADLFEERPEGLRYMSHFATCPKADTFRKPKSR